MSGLLKHLKDGGLAVRVWKSGHSFIDNITFRLHYRMTFNILIICSVLSVASTYFGAPIDCMTQKKTVPIEMMNTYCWILGTFTIPAQLTGRVGNNMPHPGIGPTTDPNLIRVTDDGDEIHHAWYQWVVFVLFAQALLFYVPHHLWKSWEGGKLKMMIQNLNEQKLDNLDTEKEKNRKEQLIATVNYFKRHEGQHQSYVAKYVFCEVLNFVNVIAQMFFMDIFLGGQFLNYGVRIFDIWRISELPFEDRVDPLSKVFPKLTKCSFNSYGPSGTVESKDGICLLAFNVMNEKIYIFLWFWFIILGVWTGMHLFIRFLSVVSMNFRCCELDCVVMLRDRLELTLLRNRPKGCKNSDLSRMIRKCNYGDFFLLMQLSKHFDPYVYYEFIIELLENKPESYETLPALVSN